MLEHFQFHQQFHKILDFVVKIKNAIFGRFYYLEHLQILSSIADLFGHDRLQIEIFQLTHLLYHLKAHLYELHISLSLQVEIQMKKRREKGHHEGQTAIL